MAQILPALLAIPIAPLYLLTGNFTLIWWAFVLQGAFGSGGFASQAPAYLSERFPTEVRATAAGFCYHQGAVWGGLVAPILAYCATAFHLGYAIPMLIGTIGAASSFIIAIALGPETALVTPRGKRGVRPHQIPIMRAPCGSTMPVAARHTTALTIPLRR